ncbi:MAG: hypothetical protein E6Q97_11130 [Desulfurellales bacterium]|nr:MAG: hypothetical protein E6Q97_11130 [Desulfurellales bacterium]
MTITFTDEQVHHLEQLLDLACKAGGLQAAVVAVPLVLAMRKANQPQEPILVPAHTPEPAKEP